MRNRRITILIALALVAASTFAGYFAQTSARRAIIHTYSDLDAALTRKDLAAYMALLTPDYTEIRLTEKPKSRSQAEENYRQIMQTWTVTSTAPVEVETFSPKSDTADMTVKRSISGNMIDRSGAFGAPGRKHKMVSVTVSLDRWQKTSARWLLKRHNISLVQVFVDGKLLPGGTVHDDD